MKNNLDKIVLSTRVRLARNYKNFPFAGKMSEEDAKKIVEITKDAVMNSSASSEKEFTFYGKKELDKKGGLLLEEHLISPGIMESGREKGLILSKDKELAIMINEEDHLRIQSIKPGYNPDEAYKQANLFDDLAEEKNEYAFSEKYGYLTSCPTNLGTGIRVSVMLHIPAITITGRLAALIRSVNRLGIEVRGAYGEGTGGDGNIYQFSNRVTLGVTEEEIINKIKNITAQIAEEEIKLREQIRNEELYDRVYRSIGLLKSSYKMDYKEFLKLNSNAVLGCDMGISELDSEKFRKLSVECAPWHIAALSEEFNDASKRDIKRAEILRNALKDNR